MKRPVYPTVTLKYKTFTFDEDGLVKTSKDHEVECNDICIETQGQQEGSTYTFIVEGMRNGSSQFCLITPVIYRLTITPK